MCVCVCMCVGFFVASVWTTEKNDVTEQLYIAVFLSSIVTQVTSYSIFLVSTKKSRCTIVILRGKAIRNCVCVSFLFVVQMEIP